jgi:Tol biopolymer transport system component
MKKIILGVLTVLILVLGGVGFYVYTKLNEDPIEISSRRGDLTFISDKDGTWDIFLLDGDGNLKNLTSASSGHDYFYSYTFEGDKLYLYSTDSGAITPALVMADGTGFETQTFLEAGMKTIQSGQVDMDPSWNATGEKMLWSTLSDNLFPELYIANRDGTDPQRLTNNGKNDVHSAWSPDGTKIAFISDRDGNIQHLFVMDIASGEVTQLSSGDGWDFQPIWSMDGTQILYISDRSKVLENGEMELYLINADGTNEQRFTEEMVFKGDPTYSPDGEQVAYMSNEDGSWHIYVMDKDGSNVRRVTEGDANYMYPAWRPVPADE